MKGTHSADNANGLLDIQAAMEYHQQSKKVGKKKKQGGSECSRNVGTCGGNDHSDGQPCKHGDYSPQSIPIRGASESTYAHWEEFFHQRKDGRGPQLLE